MFAPIFTWELRRVLHRRWLHNVRLLYAILMASIFLIHIVNLRSVMRSGPAEQALSALMPQVSAYRHFLMLMHGGAIFFLVPILSVGPILQEKRQHTLELLLTTQLRPRDIVVGHWLAALVKLAVLTSPGIPLLLWMQAILDEPWWTMAAWIGCSYLTALPLAAACLFFAVRFQRSFTVMLAGFLCSVIWLALLLSLFRDAQLSLWAHAVYHAEFWLKLTIFVGGLTTLGLAAAIRGVRFASDEAVVAQDASRACLDVGDEPIFWKQCHFNATMLPVIRRRIPGWVWVLIVGASTCGLALGGGREDRWIVLALPALYLSFPLVALIRTSGVVNAEREAGTWDSLRITPIRADDFVNQTLSAIEGRLRIFWRAVLPAIVILFARDPTFGIFAFFAWLMGGLAVRYAAVIGLHASTRINSAWGSMLVAIMTFMLRVIFYALAGIGLSFLLLSCLAAVLACRVNFGNEALFVVILLAMPTVFVANLLLWRDSNFRLADTIKTLAKKEGFEHDCYTNI